MKQSSPKLASIPTSQTPTFGPTCKAKRLTGEDGRRIFVVPARSMRRCAPDRKNFFHHADVYPFSVPARPLVRFPAITRRLAFPSITPPPLTPSRRAFPRRRLLPRPRSPRALPSIPTPRPPLRPRPPLHHGPPILAVLADLRQASCSSVPPACSSGPVRPTAALLLLHLAPLPPPPPSPCLGPD